MEEEIIEKAVRRFSHAVLGYDAVWDEFFDEMTIKVKDGMILLNYREGMSVKRDNPLVCYCRGTVINEIGIPLSIPFLRFFNLHEKESKKEKFNWRNCYALFKEDGSLINVFWNPRISEWEITTRGSFYEKDDELFRKWFLDVFDTKKLDFMGSKTKKYCFSFELITPFNPIVTVYDHREAKNGFVSLLTVRNMETMDEFSFDEVMEIAASLDVITPRRFFIKSINNAITVVALTTKENPTNEGIVVVDESIRPFKRIKMKSDIYMSLSKISQLKDHEIIRCFQENKEIDPSFMAMIPMVEERVSYLRDKYDELYDVVHREFKEMIDNLSGKNLFDPKIRAEFASMAIKSTRKPLFFNLYNKNVKNDNICWDLLTPKSLLRHIEEL